MITIVQGTPGSGKSSVATVDMLESLMAGHVVACNYDLVPDWSVQLAKLNPKVRWGFKREKDVANDYFKRAFKIGTADTISQLSKDISLLAKGKASTLREGRGRLYLDEAQLMFNSRNWKDNMGFIEFFTQHRKLGWDIFLIAHSIGMIDKQIRDLIEYETRLRNMAMVKFLGVIPLARKNSPLFFAITRYAGISAGSGEIAFRRLYTLRKAYSALYDSMEIFAFNKSSVDVKPQGRKPYSKDRNRYTGSIRGDYSIFPRSINA